jgi:transposase
LGRGQLKHKQEALTDSMEGELSARHRFVLEVVLRHIHYLEEELDKLESLLIEAMQPYQKVIGGKINQEDFASGWTN